jgi:hypothetical protein
VAKAELSPASARTRLVGPAPRILGGDQLHQVGRRSTPPQQFGHGVHRRPGVGEEQLQARTKVILAWFTVTRKREPIFRTAAVAKRPDLASATLSGQGILLVIAKFLLLGRGDHLLHVGLVNIPKQKAGLDEVSQE